MSAVSYEQVRATDPDQWRRSALAWRGWASAAGRWVAEVRAHAARLCEVWTGAAAAAVAARLAGLVRRLVLFRLDCWGADQALSAFASALARARSLPPGPEGAGTAPAIAAEADTSTADRLGVLFTPAPPGDAPTPPCGASPAEVRRWWEGLSPAQQRWLPAARPGAIGSLDGLPARVRDLANRLTLDDLPPGADGLAALRDRLADTEGPRAYLLRLDPAGDGQAVVALNDPDRAANVLTHVPGMTADLASYDGELARAERVAVRAAERDPAAATSAIMWLGYDAPDFVGEAATRGPAQAGAAELRRFQDGLRASHDGQPARQTVLGHSYGSLVVGTAAAEPGFAADGVVFVGSPGVGVDSAADLHAPPGEVWSSTSRSDVIQWAAVSPGSLVEDIALGQVLPGGVLLTTLGRPEDDLYFGRNPSDPSFGARVFASRPGGGHLGYWEPGGPSLDALADITLGRGDVIPR